MDAPGERKLWVMAGLAAVGVGILGLLYDAIRLLQLHLVNPRMLKVGVVASFVILAGLSALVISRILRALLGIRNAVNDSLWRLLTVVAAPVGVVLMIVERLRSGITGGTDNQKAVWFAGAFLIMASVIALVGERASAHLAASRSASSKPKAA